MHLYTSAISGNALKARMVLTHLGVEYESTEIDVTDQSPRVALFPPGAPSDRVPLLVLDDGSFVTESNAILIHVARGSALYSDDPREQDEIHAWLFFEQNQVEAHLAVARFLIQYVPGGAEKFDREIAFLQKRGARALKRLDQHLSEHEFLALERYTIADMSVFAYVHVAEEAGMRMAGFPNVVGWVERIRERLEEVVLDR